MDDPRSRWAISLTVSVLGVVLAWVTEGWVETVAFVVALAGGVANTVFYMQVAARSGTYSKKWWRGFGYSWWNDMDDKPTKPPR